MRSLSRASSIALGLGLCLGLAASCTSLLGDDFTVTGATGAGGFAGSGGHGLSGGNGLGGAAGHGGHGGHGGAGGQGGAPPTLAQQRVLYESYASGHEVIYSMRLDGTDRKGAIDPGSDVYFGNSSADGQTIVYEAGNDLWVANGDGSNAHQLTTNPASDYRPAISYDGSLVAFVSTRDGQANIYLVTTAQGDAGQVRRVTNTPDETTFPQFSPDNQWITYTKYATGQIYKIRVDGTEETNLTNSPSNNYCSAYSPDGATIVFSTDRDGFTELYRMNADGSNPVRITHQDAGSNLEEYHASFDMTGQWLIYYATSPEGPRAIYRTSIDGSQTVKLTPYPADGGDFDEDKTATWTFPD